MNWYWLIPVGIFLYGFVCTTIGYRVGRARLMEELDVQIIDHEQEDRRRKA